MNLSIVVPCYNEAKNIPLILERFAEVVGTKTDIEVLLLLYVSLSRLRKYYTAQLKSQYQI